MPLSARDARIHAPPTGNVPKVWEELFPVEQQRLVSLLIEAVEVSKGDVQVHLRAAGLDTLARELNEIGNQTEAAA
ncbi:MAG: hypothetical protein H7834_15100 [Magnetococcus sp. YQC-9]